MKPVERTRACAWAFGTALAVALICAGVCGCASHPEENRAEPQQNVEFEVQLPEGAGNAQPLTVSAVKVVVISVRGNVREGEPPYVVAGKRMTLAEIRDLMAAAVKQNADQKVLIRGEANALHGDVANAVAACRQAGIQEVNIGYDFEPIKP